MKQSPELNELNSRLLEIINECKSEEGTKKLQAIYDTLNGKNALQVVGIKEKVKNFLRNLSPANRNRILQKKIADARNETINAIKEYIFTADIMKKDAGMIKNLPSNLAISINRFLDVSLGVEFNEKIAKRYPIELMDSLKEQVYSRTILEMSKTYLDNHVSAQKVIEKARQQYQQKEEKIEAKCRDFEIEPYYGTKEFMECRITYIRECMEKMLHNKRFEGREDIKDNIDKIDKILSAYEKISLNVNSINAQKDRYRKLEDLYKVTLKMEDSLFPEVEEVWREKLSSIETYSKDGDFAFLAYPITEEKGYPKDKAKLSLRYITQNTLALDGEYGLIYSLSADNLFTMCSSDAENWVMTKEDFVKSRIFKTISIYRTN